MIFEAPTLIKIGKNTGNKEPFTQREESVQPVAVS